MPLKRIGGIIGAAATNKIASKVQGDEIGGLAFGILNDFLAGYREDCGFSFAEINASFYLSNDLQERRYFEGWQELSFNRSSWDMGYYNDYVGSLEIYQLDLEDRRRMGVKLFDVFPKTISGMSYDYGTTNQISTVDIGFSYRYWETLGTSDPKKGFGERVNDRVRDVIERKILSQVPKVISKL